MAELTQNTYIGEKKIPQEKSKQAIFVLILSVCIWMFECIVWGQILFITHFRLLHIQCLKELNAFLNCCIFPDKCKLHTLQLRRSRNPLEGWLKNHHIQTRFLFTLFVNLSQNYSYVKWDKVNRERAETEFCMYWFFNQWISILPLHPKIEFWSGEFVWSGENRLRFSHCDNISCCITHTYIFLELSYTKHIRLMEVTYKHFMRYACQCVWCKTILEIYMCT